ncbi:MarR family winged helix-turn-helix transcriptional regulator [Paenarthrobacter nitroguajacolicus]|uniref:MarR family winged helix-turn-helix transcriptional regulator n=1 Tax=Paenarthrobacter nitroguajacolicus TaxID=211146 RepID=UPI001AAE911F|nr:MarR family transcriptional regulator [Paenarthrobacter nitroguajacolicus]
MGQDHMSEWLDDLCWLLSQASHNLTTRMTAAFEGIGLAPRAHMVLAAAADGEHSQIELARLLGLDKTTMVVTIDELEAAGLAERRQSPTDRRTRIIAVTKAGEGTLRDADRIAREVRDAVLSPLTLHEREALVDGLRTILSEELAEPTSSSQTVRRRRSASSPRR